MRSLCVQDAVDEWGEIPAEKLGGQAAIGDAKITGRLRSRSWRPSDVLE